jgi:hypothetical protein
MKCDRCGYSDNGTGDWAHACGPVAVQRAPVANERIKELVKQAEQYALDKANEGNDEDYDYSFDDDFQEKFAEAIIRECCIALQPALRDMISRGQGRELILEHFGFNPREITTFMLDRKIKQMEKELAEQKSGVKN